MLPGSIIATTNEELRLWRLRFGQSRERYDSPSERRRQGNKRSKGCKAIEFTTQSEENEEGRHNRASGVYIEDTFNADKQRRAIRRMLDSQNLTSTALSDLSKPRTPSYDYHAFHRSSMTSKVVLSVPVVKFPVPRLTKTIARLECRRQFSSVDAMSV